MTVADIPNQLTESELLDQLQVAPKSIEPFLRRMVQALKIHDGSRDHLGALVRLTEEIRYRDLGEKNPEHYTFILNALRYAALNNAIKPAARNFALNFIREYFHGSPFSNRTETSENLLVTARKAFLEVSARPEKMAPQSEFLCSEAIICMIEATHNDSEARREAVNTINTTIDACNSPRSKKNLAYTLDDCLQKTCTAAAYRATPTPQP